eukprot:3617715-Pyramimonas_sp.AAC.1
MSNATNTGACTSAFGCTLILRAALSKRMMFPTKLRPGTKPCWATWVRDWTRALILWLAAEAKILESDLRSDSGRI